MWWWILHPLARRARAHRRAVAAAERRQSAERKAAFERILALARRDR